MTNNELDNIMTIQRNFFLSGSTLPISYRINALKKLQSYIKNHEAEINEALHEDLGKSNFESYMCETGLVLDEINYMIKHIKNLSRTHKVRTPLVQFASKSYVKPSPYGTVLIMSPWNYPFLLSLGPLTDAIAAGNTIILKPSAYSPSTSKLIKKIIDEVFSPELVYVITGGRDENSALLCRKFDYIFFTGSQNVGKLVMQSASKWLTPVTLELGGKSPCIIDKTADIRLAARRIVFGKYLNCGQTCVAPDYVYCHKDIEDVFITAVKDEIIKQFGSDYINNNCYGKIINEKHFNRILQLINHNKVVYGGNSDISTLKIEPTVMKDITWEDSIMKEEIFGPLMPIITYNETSEVISAINAHPHPLALYIFTSDKKNSAAVLSGCSFGGGCVNDTVIHLATPYMGFGGVGESGMGSYHGKSGFNAFSHLKSIVDKKTWIDLSMRYQPYNRKHEKIMHKFLK